MAAYNVSWKLRDQIRQFSASEKEEWPPNVDRVSASDAQRAISRVVNDLKSKRAIRSKADIIVLEAKVVA